MAHHQVLPGQLAILTDREAAIASRVERVRFLITSKESEEQARRSVMLGVLGGILGAISLVLGVAGLRRVAALAVKAAVQIPCGRDGEGGAGAGEAGRDRGACEARGTRQDDGETLTGKNPPAVSW
jgi:hypothetical protein